MRRPARRSRHQYRLCASGTDRVAEIAERHPEADDNRWARPELLAAVGDLDEAYRVADRLPAATEAERFERDALLAHLDIVAGRSPDIDALAEQAERLATPGSDEHLRAVAGVALSRARQRLAHGRDDWMEPLLEAQARIGARALSVVRADTWRRRFAALLVAGAAVVLGAELIALVPSR